MSEAAIRQRLAKPKTSRAKRILKDKAPKVIEDPKKQILLRGNRTSPIMNEIMKDLHKLKSPYSLNFSRRNDKRPFEDFSSVKFLCDKNNCSLFTFCSNSKKRSNNIIFGRTFDFNLLDMYEFGIDATTYQSIKSFQSVIDYKSNDPKNKSFSYGSKPALLFQGESFQNDPLLKDIKSFFIDYFNGQVMKKFNLITLDHVIVFTVINLDEISMDKQTEYKLNENGNGPIIMFRHYKIEYQSSSHSKLSYAHLTEIGPAMDMKLRRFEKGNDEIIKLSKQRIDKQLLTRKPKQKNVYLDNVFKQRTGRIYIEHKEQDLKKLKLKKMKALRDRNRSKNYNKNKPKKKKNSNNRKKKKKTTVLKKKINNTNIKKRLIIK
eukprot:471734_1